MIWVWEKFLCHLLVSGQIETLVETCLRAEPASPIEGLGLGVGWLCSMDTPIVKLCRDTCIVYIFVNFLCVGVLCACVTLHTWGLFEYTYSGQTSTMTWTTSCLLIVIVLNIGRYTGISAVILVFYPKRYDKYKNLPGIVLEILANISPHGQYIDRYSR